MGDNFVYITYHAVFNQENDYLGALEVTQEISELKKLEGQKTLLD